MHRPPSEARAHALSGIESLRKGDAHKARQSFERVVATGQADASAYLGLAYACAGLKDHSAALAAVDRAPPADQLPADLRGELGRAEAMCGRYAAQFEAFLRERLLAQGPGERRSNARFRDSLDLLMGKKKIYFQEPRQYFFPGLPQIQFYDRDDFPWLDKVEAATADIRTELIEILKQESAFRPYVEGNPRLPQTDPQGMLNNPEWSAFYLWKNGAVVPENAARCPKTVNALADVPLARVRNRSPSILYSLLRPGAKIPPHTGEVNTRLICHLPLIVPDNCAFRVGNDTRAPVEGAAWVFDDTIEHEAWNGSDRTRVILLFEIWRPELTLEERALVSAMFEAIDAYAPAPEI